MSRRVAADVGFLWGHASLPNAAERKGCNLKLLSGGVSSVSPELFHVDVDRGLSLGP